MDYGYYCLREMFKLPENFKLCLQYHILYNFGLRTLVIYRLKHKVRASSRKISQHFRSLKTHIQIELLTLTLPTLKLKKIS